MNIKHIGSGADSNRSALDDMDFINPVGSNIKISGETGSVGFRFSLQGFFNWIDKYGDEIGNIPAKEPKS